MISTRLTNAERALLFFMGFLFSFGLVLIGFAGYHTTMAWKEVRSRRLLLSFRRDSSETSLTSATVDAGMR